MEPDKVRGYINVPNQPTPKKDDTSVDPEKFKKTLKVDDSGEAEKRQQRQKKRSEHEGETDEESTPAAPAPPHHVETQFSEFMSDELGPGSILDAQGGKSAVVGSPDLGGADVDYSYGTGGGGQGLDKTIYSAPTLSPETPAPPAEVVPPPPTQTAPPAAQIVPEGPVALPTPGQQSEQTPSSTPTQSQSPPSETLAERREKGGITPPTVKKEHKDRSLMAGKAPKQESLKEKRLREKYESLGEEPPEEPRAEEKPVTEKKGKQLPESDRKALPQGRAPLPHEETVPTQPPQKGAPEERAELKQSGFIAPPPKEAGKKELAEEPKQGAPVLALPEQPAGSGGGKEGFSHDKKKEDETTLPSEMPAPAQPLAVPIDITPLQQTGASRLPPEVFALFEKSVGLITVQHFSGDVKTTVMLDMKGSIFDGAEIIITQTKTAQSIFNIELNGTPEAVQLFNENIDGLTESFLQKQFPFEVNLLTASIQRKYRPVMRKEGDTDSGSDKK